VPWLLLQSSRWKPLWNHKAENWYFLALFFGSSSISQIFYSKSAPATKQATHKCGRQGMDCRKGNMYITNCLAKNFKPQLPPASVPPSINLILVVYFTNTQQTSTKPALMLFNLKTSSIVCGTSPYLLGFLPTCLVSCLAQVPQCRQNCLCSLPVV